MSEPQSRPLKWPKNVPAEAVAVAMLRGQQPPGEFESVVKAFLATLRPLEASALQRGSNAALVSALAVRWRLTAAAAVAPISPSEVDPTAVAALAQEADDAAFGLTSDPGKDDPTLKPVFESNRALLKLHATQLHASVPRDEPRVAAAPSPEPAPRMKSAPASAPSGSGRSPAVASPDQQARRKGLLVVGAVVLVLGVAVHGVRLMLEQSDLDARRKTEAALPSEFTTGKVTVVNLRSPSPEKVVELRARAASEGKRLLQFSSTEFQLVEDPALKGAAPAPAPVEAPAAPAVPAEAPDAGGQP